MKNFQYNKCYPLFESKVKHMIQVIERRIVFNTVTSNELIFLDNLKTSLLNLIILMNKKPTLSNVNLEFAANSLKKRDSSLEVILLRIDLKENPNLSKTGSHVFKLYK